MSTRSKMHKFQVRDLMRKQLIDWVVLEIEDMARQGESLEVMHWSTELVRITSLSDVDKVEVEYIKFLRTVCSNFDKDQYNMMMLTFYLND